jgi:tRNA-modifying protein YgfZ
MTIEGLRDPAPIDSGPIDLGGLASLPYLGALLVAGAGARGFLQGQLSTDIEAPQRGIARLASCNSAQGRVQAVVWLIERTDGIALVTAAALVEMLSARLRKYVLRSKVTIAADALRIGALRHETAPTLAVREHLERDGVSFVHLPGHDEIVAIGAVSGNAGSVDEARWRLEDIRAGVPQIQAQTHEHFVAQMLNLDLLGGISFEKGCYTGQEIIARTHYRGAVKRRMFRYRTQCAPPAPGTRVLSAGQHAGDVVDSATTGTGCELLAVVSLAQAGEGLRLDDAHQSQLEQLSLPYDVA